MSDATTGTPTNTAAPATPPDAKTTTTTPAAQATPGQTPTGATPGTGNAAVSDAAKEAMKKYKVKVSGQELEVDESELLRGYSHKQAAAKEMQEAKRLRKQNEEFVAMMKDPSKFFETGKKLGHDPRKLAEEFLAAQLKRELADPRDVELEDTKTKLKMYEELEQRQREAEKQRHHDEMKKRFAEEYKSQFIEVLETSGLPKTKEMVGEMAKYIHRASKIGFKMSPQEAAILVKEDLQTRVAAIVGQSEGDILLKLLGDDTAAKLLAARGAQVKDPNAQLTTPTEQTRSERGKPRERMNQREWRRFNRGGYSR